MSEYIVKESGYPGAIKQEIVGELVRCRECKYYVIHSLFGHSQGWCERLCDEFDRSLAHGTEKDGYCSHGERA